MASKKERIATAAVAITIGSAFGGPVGAIVGAAATDYAIQKATKRKGDKAK